MSTQNKILSKSQLTTRISILLIGGFLFGLIYFLFSPEDSIYFPKCPLHQLTGLDCPGCGSQRAIHHLLHFNILNAMKYNLILVISIPYLLLATYFEYFGGKEKYPTVRQRLYGKEAGYIVFGIILAFGIVRNIIPIF